MTALDDLLQDAVASGVVPFVSAGLVDRDGVRWQGSAGAANATTAAGSDTVCRLFSATKAIGSIAALIAVDRGLFTLDTPVGDIVPRFDALQVLEAVTDAGPVFHPPRTRATLRHLLTHRQGQSYDAFSPLMSLYAEKTGAPNDLTGLWDSLDYPLLFEPGEDFAYGIATDWVGVMVATADGRAIEDFVQQEILDPLGMTKTFFEVDDVADQVADVRFKRFDDEGGFDVIDHKPPSRPEFYHMGQALYGTPRDYLTFLRFLLNRGELDGRRLMSEETWALAFTDLMEGVPLPSPVLTSLIPHICHDVDVLPGTPLSHSAVAFLNLEDVPGRRSAGSVTWGGILHTMFWVDPAAGIGGVFFTQMLPYWEPGVMSVFEQFERLAYAELAD